MGHGLHTLTYWPGYDDEVKGRADGCREAVGRLWEAGIPAAMPWGLSRTFVY